MNLKALVDRRWELESQIETLTTELTEIDAKIKDAALKGEHLELKNSDREGRRYMAHGTSRILRVVFTADKIVGTFQKNSAVHKAIVAKAGEHFLSFFKPVEAFKNLFEDGKKFRAHADAMLGKEAPQFITACLSRDKDGLPKSDVKIEWDATEPAKEGK